jgi:hypothetical protein
MIIRKEQIGALEEASIRGFENRMLERLRTHFPKHETYLGEPQLRVMVQAAVERAKSHGLTAERSIALYLDLMCVLGGGFDKDPQIPWASAILDDPALPTQDERIDLLHARGWEFARKVSVDFENPLETRGGSRLVAGFGEIRNKSLEDVAPDSANRVSAEIVAKLKALFPVKSQTIGDECVGRLVQYAVESAASYEIRNERGVWLFAALMFVVGAGFDRDPQLPWAENVLSDKSIGDSAAVVNRLFTEARMALKQWWGIDPGAQS